MYISTIHPVEPVNEDYDYWVVESSLAGFMHLSEETIRELQTILREEYGAECDFAKSAEIATNLVRYAEQLQEITNNNYE